MPQSLVKNYLHIVFSTKNRTPFLNPILCKELYPYASTVLKNLKCPAMRIGGTQDHIHILCLLSKNITIADLLEKFKTPTSKWMKTKGREFGKFYWQGGYAAFSVSQSNVKRVEKYIDNQKEHHRTMTFQEELRELFRKHEIEFDERYVWD